MRGGSSGAQRPCSGETRGGCGVASGADADLRAGLMKRPAAGFCIRAAASGLVGGSHAHSRCMCKVQHAEHDMTTCRGPVL